MVVSHLKRLRAPRTWPILRKERVFIAKPFPSPAGLEQSLPVVVAVRDLLKIAGNAREVKYLINEGKIRLNGKRVKSYKQPLGLFDVLGFPEIDAYYRLSLNKKGKLAVLEIEKSESDKFIFKIIGKKMLPGNKVQVNFSSGMNIFVPSSESSDYKTGNCVLASYPPIKVIEHLPMKEGMKVFILSGKHRGNLAEVSELFPERRDIVVKLGESHFEISDKSVIIVGKEEPAIRVTLSD